MSALAEKNMNELKTLIKDIIEYQSSPSYNKNMVKEYNDPYGN